VIQSLVCFSNSWGKLKIGDILTKIFLKKLPKAMRKRDKSLPSNAAEQRVARERKKPTVSLQAQIVLHQSPTIGLQYTTSILWYKRGVVRN
jgi:hypothetical protein